MRQAYHDLRIPLDPGRSRGWSSARIWRWLTAAERLRVEGLGGYLSMREPALPPREWADRFVVERLERFEVRQ
jgi:hypothetical protein